MAEFITNPKTVEGMQQRINDLLCDLDMAEMGFLTHCGWKHTSSTPDSVWVWEKEFSGKMLQVDRNRALAIEGVHRG